MNQEFWILIVDDDVGIASYLKDILEGEGYNTAIASDGQTALTLCREREFDIGLIDIKLPDIQGVELVEKLVELSPATKHILITGYASLESAIEAVRQNKIVAYEEKPLDMNHFLPLVRQVTERKLTMDALQESEERYRQLVELSPDTISIHSEGKIVFINHAGVRLLGAANPEQLIGKPIMDFVHPDYQENIEGRIREMGENGRKAQLIEEKFIRLDGTYVDVEVAAVPLTYQGRPAVQAVARDITERKRTEERIKTSLREKEVLLREVHHRVKNNLQIISSLIDMRIMRTDNQQAIDFFEDTRSKIHTMALIHSQLYQSERFDQINMGTHIRQLIDYLSKVYAKRDVVITPLVEHSDVYLSITQAIPCALVLNELISNAFKHAFKERQKGTIKLSLKQKDHNKIFLMVKDNGIGIPEEIDILKTNSLGFKLMRNTVQHQLMGKIHIERGIGTKIIVEFEILEEKVNHVQNTDSR